MQERWDALHVDPLVSMKRNRGETEGKGVPGSPQAVERKNWVEEEATITVVGLRHPETQQANHE